MRISVLVPVYGVERFIGECAVSLFEQSYQNLEYVFVDDCSPDGSISVLREVLRRYPQREGQVHIIRHDRNRGLGAARATALSAATGEAVMVVDSDDVVPRDAVMKLWRQMEATGADMVDGAFCRLLPNGLEVPVFPFRGKKDRMLRLMLLHNTVPHHLWGWLVRRSVYTDNGINSVEGVNMAEDYAVTPRLLFCSTKRASIDDVVYHYRDNADSTFSDHLTTRHILSFLQANRTVYAFLQERQAEGQYRLPVMIGMLQVFHAAMKVGMSVQEVEQACGYRMCAWLRWLCSPKRLSLLYNVYLVLKFLYKQWLALGCR